MRVFGSRYFAYDENILRAADALGVEYVLARGTAGERATVYAPREYKAKIISVSNVPFGEMGTGSLCDYSLWARGSTDEDSANVVDKVLARRPSDKKGLKPGATGRVRDNMAAEIPIRR